MKGLRILKIFSFSSLFLLLACGQPEKREKADEGQKSIKTVEVNVSEPDATVHQLPKLKVQLTRDRKHPMKQMSGAAMPGTSPAFKLHSQTGEVYQSIAFNEVTRAGQFPVSTFSIDVDTGAYSNIRRFLKQGQLPPADAVRIEEMVNYFNYQYPAPVSVTEPFKISAGLTKTPWNQKTHLLSIAVQGFENRSQALPSLNLVFLVDVSGSMDSPNKLPLVQQSLKMLVSHLREKDQIAIVAYAGNSAVALQSTSGNKKQKINHAIDQLRSTGSTNGAEGIITAYQIAKQNYQADGINRVLLATDGDFNVGLTQQDELEDLIVEQREQGIFLNTLGFGQGNYNDYLMEQLADRGNGQYAYIDSMFEAKKVLVDEVAKSLFTIAKDVKIQLEFNPAVVHEYRLIGYENRKLTEQDFDNDRVDAGEVGAGHSLTALYEVSLVEGDQKRLSERRYADAQNRILDNRSQSNEFGRLKLRYKTPDSDKSQLMTEILTLESIKSASTQDADFQFAAAVAAFGQILNKGLYINDFSFQQVIQLATANKSSDLYGRKAEFIQLVSMARELNHPLTVPDQLGATN